MHTHTHTHTHMRDITVGIDYIILSLLYSLNSTFMPVANDAERSFGFEAQYYRGKMAFALGLWVLGCNVAVAS